MNATWPDAANWSCPVPFPDGAEQLSEHLYEMICLLLSAQHGAFTWTIGVDCPGVVCPGWHRWSWDVPLARGCDKNPAAHPLIHL